MTIDIIAIANKIASKILDEYTVGEFDGGFCDEPAGFDATSLGELALTIKLVLDGELK